MCERNCFEYGGREISPIICVDGWVIGFLNAYKEEGLVL